MARKNKYKWAWDTAGFLVIVGALNWGLTVLNFNLIQEFANLLKIGVLENFVYVLMGVSGLAFILKKMKVI